MTRMRMSNRLRFFAKRNLSDKTLKKIRDIRGIPERLRILEENQRNLINSQLVDLKKGKKANLRGNEFQIYSQNGEDGILLHIFSKIGVMNKTFVEFGIGDGRECNTANLSINHGWKGLLMNDDAEDVIRAKRHYRQTNGRVKLFQCFVTRNNINQVLKSNGISGKIDLLSIDMDGNDYWVWEKIGSIDPNVVIIEYNGSFGSDKSISVCYDPQFDRLSKHPSGFYHGASLRAFTKLGREKGYSLVGCDKTGCNAFFVKKGLAKKLDTFTVEEAFYPHSRRLKNESTEEQFNRIKHMKFEKI
jgi:hypothetical protein